ncbi:MAG: DUF2520 domain-containing protein [Planctomycetes bacterium]|nr:DUF2520 domain-containing protein [Planctomycetota bacterium]
MSGKITVSIIGVGKSGQTIGRLLQKSGRYRVVAVFSRNKNQTQKAARFIGGEAHASTDILKAASQGDIVFITVPDDNIKSVFQYLSSKNAFKRNAVIIHCSGNFSSDILKNGKTGVKAGTIHPLQTIASPAEAVRFFKGTFCSYEADSPSVRSRLVHLIKAMGGVPVRIDKKLKPLYHSAGVIASNYLVTLVYLAREFLKKAGFPKDKALPALMPLVNGAVNNINKIGLTDALTGPIARGDVNTIKEHIRAIKLTLPEYLPFYIIAGKETIKLGLAKGTLSRPRAKELSGLFKGNL